MVSWAPLGGTLRIISPYKSSSNIINVSVPDQLDPSIWLILKSKIISVHLHLFLSHTLEGFNRRAGYFNLPLELPAWKGSKIKTCQLYFVLYKYFEHLDVIMSSDFPYTLGVKYVL